jgi:hypothetical protein
LAEPIFAKHEAGDECRGLGDGAFRRSRRPSRRFRSESNFRVVRPDLVLYKMHDTVRLAIRARISGRDRPKISGSDGRGHAPTLRSGKGQRSCRGLCDGKELSRHIVALDPSQKADSPKSVAWYYYESGKNGSRDQVG